MIIYFTCQFHCSENTVLFYDDSLNSSAAEPQAHESLNSSASKAFFSDEDN